MSNRRRTRGPHLRCERCGAPAAHGLRLQDLGRGEVLEIPSCAGCWPGLLEALQVIADDLELGDVGGLSRSEWPGRAALLVDGAGRGSARKARSAEDAHAPASRQEPA